MLEIVAGTLLMLGGGMLTGSAVLMTRIPRRSALVAASLSYTPLPPADPLLTHLMAHAASALDRQI